MAPLRRIPWFPLTLAALWVAMTALAIREMNDPAVTPAPLVAAAPARPSFTEEILVVGPRRRTKAPAALAKPASKAPAAHAQRGARPEPG